MFTGTDYSTILFISEANAAELASVKANAAILRSFGRVTVVALKGIDTNQLTDLTPNFIPWDLTTDAPPNWQQQFQTAYDC